MALPAGFVLVEPQKTKLPEGYTLVSQKNADEDGLPSIAKKAPVQEPREAPTYDPLGQVIGDVAAPMDYTVEGQGKMNEPGAFTTIADLAKQFIAPGAKAPFALPLATETAAKGLVRQTLEQPESGLTSAVQPGIVRLLSPLLMQQRDAMFGPRTEEDRLKKQLEIQRTIASIPSIPGAKELNKIGENVQKDIQNSLSPEAKKALEESQITGNIFKGEVDFGTNPNAYGYALQAANVFGSMAPVIATAMVTKSPGAGGYVGGTMAADEAATKAAEFINKIPDAELRQKSPIYAELIAAGASPKEARELTIKKAAESGAILQGLVATFGDVLTGKLVTGAFDKAIAKLGTNRLARGVGVGTVSGLEESLQETGEGLASDVTLKNVIPSKEIGEDSAANLILGFLGGAGPGAAKGALSQGEQAEKAPEREKYVKPEGGLAELIARQKGFLTPQGTTAVPPAAPTGIAPAAPVVPAAPASEALDTQAMLEELINSVNSNIAPNLQKPEVEKPVETPEEQAPPTIKIYRGHRIGEEFKGADDGNLGAGFYTTESEQAAKEFASRNKNGTVLQGELNAKRILDMDNLTKEDIANLKRAIPTTAEGLQALGEPYYNDVTNELTTESLQKIHRGLDGGYFDPRNLSNATGEGLKVLAAIYKEAGYDAITRMGDALKSGTKYKEYVTFSPESQKLLTPKVDEELEPDEAFGITGGKAPQPQEFLEAKQAVDDVTKQVIKMRAKPAGSLWSKLTGALNPEEVREIFGNNPNLGQRKLQVVQGKGRGSYIVDLVDNGTLDAFLPPDKRHDANNFDAAESAQLIKDAIGEKDYLPFDAKTEIEMMFDSVKFAEDLVNEYLTQEEQNRELQIAADEQREADQNAEITKPSDKNRPAGTGEREALKLTGETPEEVRAKLAEQERRTKEEERAKKAAEEKARADQQAAEFTLTGSDREADVAAARGQKDIFAAPESPKPQTEQERTVSMTKKEFREDKETRGKSDHPALKMVFEGMTPKGLIDKYGEKDVRFLGRLFDIDVKDKFNVAKKLVAIDKGLSLIRGKTKADFDKMNKEMLGGYLEAIGQSKFGKKYELVDRLLKHEGNVMGKFYDKLQDLKHKAAIINQARAGKPISEEVLKDYPDVAAYTLPRGSEGYKTAIRSLMMKSLPTLGMDIPAMVEAYRGDAKTTKDPVEKYVATDLADSMEQYHKTQFEKRNALNAKIEAAQEPTMTSMAAESRLIKEKLAAIDKDLTKSKSLKAMRGEKFVPDALDKKAIAIYKQIKENNPEAEVDEYIENPNTAHDIEEKPNAKDIRIGDLVYEKGDPVPKIAITVDKDSVKLIDQKTGVGVFSKIESVSKEPIPHDYSFDFGYGKIDVDVETFTSPTEWSVSMSGPGAGKTGYRSALGVKFEGKRGTPAFDEFVEKVVRNNTKEAAEAAPKDNKKEIADLKKEQKTLMLQIIKAGLEETPEQEARMAEIDKRLRELEGKPAIQKEEKPAAKQRSVEEIEEELQDLEDQLDLELNKEKRMALASEISKLQGELTAAEARAARAAAEEPTEEPAEEPEAPKGTVATPDGAVLRYPLAVSLVDDGYKVLALDDPRTYKDKGGDPHRTFEKGPLRIAMTPQRVLFQNRNSVNVAFGNPDQVTLEAIMVDPGKRNQGLATQAMNDVIEAADKNEITLYLEPVPIVNIKKNDFGLDRDQLVDFYSKFGFEFQEDSNKVMQRKPSAEVEVLPAEEPQAAGLIENEPYTFEGDFTEVAEEQQRLMLENQTENLSDAQVETLEKHYGVGIDTDEFFTKLREDVSNFIVKGATAVNGKIRAIIRQLANGLLSVAIAFNPQYMSQPLNVFMPEDNVRAEEVLATVPDAATNKMSEPGKRAFAVIYPAIQEQMQKKDKLFIVADKPSGRVFVFNPDGSLLLEKKSLFGLAKGDIYVGDNDKPQNRITPAGLFDLQLIDAKKGESEKRTAGDYDTGTVLAINDPDGRITIMHSVWLKENDAAQRAAALRNESAADSRYSFGCINVDAPTYSYLVNNHAKQMDGAALFIVPEVGTDVMSFITGKGAMSEDLARVKIKPVTKVTKTPKKQATPAAAQTKVPGKEEEIFMSLESAALADGLVNMVNSMADNMDQDEKKRAPSVKRQIKTYNRQRKNGKMSDEMFVMMTDAAIREDEERRLAEEPKARKRGYLHIQNRLNEAVQAGDLSREAFDLANWFMLQNEDLVADLGVSIVGKGPSGSGGFYNNLSRVFTLIKEGGSNLTATHEILHHLERMMPTKIRQAIRKAWLTQLTKAAKATKDPVQKLYYEAVIDANLGDNRHTMLNIPEGAGKAYANARMALEDMYKGGTSAKLAETLLLQGAVPMDLYQFFNPSEFWAVNGTRIVEGRYEAVKGGNLGKLKNWLGELGQKIKSIFGLKSDASIIRALDSLSKSDGKFVTDEMLGQGDYQSIERRNYQGGEAPEPDMEIPEMSVMDNLIQKFGDKHIDTKRLIQSIESTGRKIHEQFDAYMKEENYHGRLAKRTEDFLDDEMRPLLQDMQDQGVTLDELEKFLLNRHAKEANAYIAKINPTGFPDAGSSVTDEAADEYMASLSKEQMAKYTALANRVDKIIKETQRVLVANGIETQETIDEWNKTYKFYVPLMRDQLDFVHTGRGVMGGFATRGPSTKRRVGSDKPVIDILANIAMMRERALRRSEQARVGRALYGMAIKHPNPGFWLAINPDAIKDKDKLEAELISLGLKPEDAESIIQEPRQPVFDRKTGLVKYQVNPLLRNSPNVFPVRVNGEDRFIFFNPNDPRALRMVESMRNMDTETLGDAIGAVGAVTRWIASVNTQYNIVFGGVNFLRDLGAANLNLSTTEIAGKEKEVRSHVLPALRAIYRDLRGKGATTPEMKEMQDWFERYQLAGGQTGYQNQFAESARKANIVERELKQLNRGNVKKAVDSVFDWLSDYNDAIENAVRLAAFRVAVEEGKLSEDKAASIAKNLTVNFNRKGAKSGIISALYAFFNAAVQGSARLIETLRGPMGKKIILGGMFLGSMQAIALAMAGFDDDEPPEFVKDKNFIVPIPFTDKKYLSIPYPLGFNMFPGFGRLATEVMLINAGIIKSRKGIGDKMVSAASLVLDAFNPLGGSGNPLLMVAPTILDPFAAIYSNRDAFGRPIYREDKSTAPTPGYERSRENASLFSKKLAEALNWATSPRGTEHTKGWLSPTADQIDYFIGQMTGGVGREVMKAGELLKSKATTQEEVPAYKIPVVGRFYGEAESPAATRSRFYENVTEMAKHEHEIKGLRKDKVSPAEYIKANPEARLWQRANNVENQVSKLNKEKRALIEKDAPREVIKRKEDEILKKMQQFNDQVKRGQ